MIVIKYHKNIIKLIGFNCSKLDDDKNEIEIYFIMDLMKYNL